MKKIAFCAFLLLLVGCASQIMPKYVGQPVSEIMMDYGQPDFIIDTGPDQRTYVFKETDTSVSSGEIETVSEERKKNKIVSTSTITPPQQETDTCYYSFYARKTGTDANSPHSWTVTGFRKPTFMCE